MSRRLLFPVVALVVIAGGFFALRTFLGRDGDARGDAIALAPRGSALSPPSQDGALPTRDEQPLPSAGSARSAVTVLEVPEGAEAFALDGARWIEGRVLFPLGAPPEPELAVVAIASEDPPVPTAGSATWRSAGGDWRSYVEDSTRWSRRVIAADGSFRLPLPSDGRMARLFLDGRFLFLREPLELDLSELEPVELEAELGAEITVRVTPPRNLSGAATELVGAEVELTGAKGGGMFGMMGGGGLRRTRELPESLELELGGLPADHTYFLAVDPKVFLGARELEIAVEPGRVKTLDVAIEPGATIAGRVQDDSGAPVEGARVSVDLKSQFARMSAGADRSAESAADGSFRLRGVQARKLEVRARKDGLIEARSTELTPVAGQELGDVELVMQRGATIAGHVRHADGAPASDVRVSLLAVRRGDEEPVWNERNVTTTDAAGAFSRSGLSAERTYEVVASIADEGEHAGYRARADGVAPGTRDLELVLSAPEGLSGVVRSDAGEPIRKYSIRARLAESPFGREGSVRTEVDAPDGRFRLAGVYRGSWTITVEAEGWVTQLETVSVEVPTDASFEVVMLRAASIAGVVLDPLGEVAAGAGLRLSRGAAPTGGGGGPFGGFTRSDGETTADGEGKFRFDGLRPGKVRIGASDERWAPAPELALELVAGQALADVVLNLGIGGTLTGEIFDAEGNPDAGRAITAMDMGGGGRGGRNATSDEAGHFVFEHLSPGSLMVMAQPRISALAELAEREEELSPVDFMESMKMKTIVIVENQTTHVVLGEPPANPVRLFGRVSEGGRPVETGTVMAVAEGRSIVEAWKPARVAAGGAYEMTVDEPGRYVLVYQAEAFQEGGIEFMVTVPEVSEHRFDLELPGGSISGIVFGPDGAPMRDVSVTLSRDSGVQATSIFSMGRRERSDESGRFAFDRLEAGSYSLRAGGQSMPGGFGGGGDADRLGAVLVSDLVVEPGKTLGGVELRLKRAGGLTGTVIGSDGEPVAGATIFIRDGSGRPIQGFSTTVTDGEGRFEHASLAPGDYSVSARTNEAVSSASVTARVREGDKTEVQVRVEDGVMVRVVAETPEGDPTRATVSVVDEQGREHANLRSMASIQTEFTEGLSTTEIRVGPVPPGKYVVTVTAESGEVEQRTISLSASRSERKLRLRFGE